MSSIFDMAFGKIDLTDEIHRLIIIDCVDSGIICCEEDIIYDNLSLEKFIDNNCFVDWKERGTYRSLNDIKKICGLAKIREETSLDESKATCYLEYLVNMIHLFEHNHNLYDYYYDKYTKNKLYKVMRDNIDYILSQLNLMEYKIPDKDVMYEIIPAKAEICEAIEVTDNNDIKCDILKYNHISIRDNLAAKQKILANLYKDFESKKGRLKQGGYTDIESNLGFLFNNLGIRHNDQKAKPAIKAMSDPEKLEWCNRCFQLYVTTILIDEYLTEHKAEIETLKKKDEDEIQN